ncbi:hypothetical protein [Chondromyces crocatus]|nr:hypothetical protein [Chondromyces crocatus]
MSVGLEFMAFEKYMRRTDGGGDLFAPASSLEPQAGCQTCEPAKPGGKLMAISASFVTVGPRVEFTPFGEDGLYVGAMGGAAMVQGLDGSAGLGGAVRAGFRLRPVPAVTLGLEGGLQAQTFKGGSVVAPFASLILRPYF